MTIKAYSLELTSLGQVADLRYLGFELTNEQLDRITVGKSRMILHVLEFEWDKPTSLKSLTRSEVNALNQFYDLDVPFKKGFVYFAVVFELEHGSVGYLKAPEQIGKLWSEQLRIIETYEQSDEWKAKLAEIERDRQAILKRRSEQ